jgi:uncharacterized protein
MAEEKIMKIAIVGATGFIGQHIFNEAVARQHQITALVRNLEKVTAAAGVTAQALNLQDTQSLSAALAGHDAVTTLRRLAFITRARICAH